MDKFDLEAAKSGSPVRTKNGLNVRLVCFDVKGAGPLLGIVEKPWCTFPIFYNLQGECTVCRDTGIDLVMGIVQPNSCKIRPYELSSRIGDEKYILIDTHQGDTTFFEDEAERDAMARELIMSYLDNGGWGEGVEQILTGVVTHQASMKDVVFPPQREDFQEEEDFQEQRRSFGSFDFYCQYELTAVPKHSHRYYLPIARVAHEACLAMSNNYEAVSWEKLPSSIADSCQETARYILENKEYNGEKVHEFWCNDLLSEGYTYGKKFDSYLKTNPCLIPYSALTEEYKLMLKVFISVVRAMGESHA